MNLGPDEPHMDGSTVPTRAPEKPITNVRPKVGRNAPCPACTSGRKFKVCCGNAIGPMPAVRK